MSYFCFEDTDTKLDILEPNRSSRRIKKHDGKLMMVEVYMENGCVSEPHAHPHEQMSYILEGEVVFNVGNESKLVKAGDTVYMPPNVVHNCELKSESCRLLDVFTPIREDFLG